MHSRHCSSFRCLQLPRATRLLHKLPALGILKVQMAILKQRRRQPDPSPDLLRRKAQAEVGVSRAAANRGVEGRAAANRGAAKDRGAAGHGAEKDHGAADRGSANREAAAVGAQGRGVASVIAVGAAGAGAAEAEVAAAGRGHKKTGAEAWILQWPMR